jgi:hypothetical protein
MGTTEPIHESDPDQAPDSDFEPGELHHLVPGNTGRMLDTRRTPVRVGSVDPDLGTFEIEVLAFEDRGARWLVEGERVSHFQFPPDAPRADVTTVTALAAAVERFGHSLHVPIDPRARVRTRARLRDEERRAAAVLGDAPRIDTGGRAMRRMVTITSAAAVVAGEKPRRGANAWTPTPHPRARASRTPRWGA